MKKSASLQSQSESKDGTEHSDAAEYESALSWTSDEQDLSDLNNFDVVDGTGSTNDGELRLGESIGLGLGGAGGIGEFFSNVFVRPVLNCGNVCAKNICG